MTSTRVSAYTCPSDPNGLVLTGIGPTLGGVKFNVTSQNYVINFGNLTTSQPNSWDVNGVTYYYGGAPFSDIEKPNPNANQAMVNAGRGCFGFAAFTDGTSNTLLASEGLVGVGGDLRGFSWWGSAASFTSWLTPNSTQPDVLESASYCKDPSLGNPPCIAPTDAYPRMNGVRSKHPGGVNAAMGDGAVRFIKNSINPYVWRGLSTTQGNEVISSDSY